MSDDTTRPGGWVNGIGWVALLRGLCWGDRIAYRFGGGELVVSELTAMSTSPVIVVRWADGTAPTGPAPTGLEPAAAPRVDTAAVREIAALFDPPHPADAGLLYAAADELDTHHARHAELVALVADLRENGEKFRQYGYLGIAEHLARILGEQP